MSRIRRNFHSDCEDAINKQIHVELSASHCYLSMAYRCDENALKGFSNYFRQASKEKRERAEKLMKYQNSRGGIIVLKDIPKPTDVGLITPDNVVSTALQLEKDVNTALLDVHATARKHNDFGLSHLLQEHLQNQVDVIKSLADVLRGTYTSGSNLGLLVVDEEIGKLPI